MKIEKTHLFSRHSKSINLLLLSSYIFIPLIMGTAYTDFHLLLNTIIIVAIYLFINRFYRLTKEDLKKIDSHTKLTIISTDSLFILIRKNIWLIGFFIIYFALKIYKNDDLAFAFLMLGMLIVILIFTNRQQLTFTDEQVFLIYPNGHEQMDVKSIQRILWDKNKVTFIDLDHQMRVSMLGWNEAKVERLRTYLEHTLSISIPKN